jgi:hypothetical protein
MNRVANILIYAVITIIGLIGGWQLGIFIFEAFSIPLNPYLVYGLCTLLVGVIGFLIPCWSRSGCSNWETLSGWPTAS